MYSWSLCIWLPQSWVCLSMSVNPSVCRGFWNRHGCMGLCQSYSVEPSWKMWWPWVSFPYSLVRPFARALPSTYLQWSYKHISVCVVWPCLLQGCIGYFLFLCKTPWPKVTCGSLFSFMVSEGESLMFEEAQQQVNGAEVERHHQPHAESRMWTRSGRLSTLEA